ncbi:hypothetical protein HZ326_3285 [Fusarium oxysporum f. sp. albedinis]|nr:hypothetical protein HZ326_3285 [Fusarium oxysporum f. sp. albedinis]
MTKLRKWPAILQLFRHENDIQLLRNPLQALMPNKSRLDSRHCHLAQRTWYRCHARRHARIRLTERQTKRSPWS